MTIKELCEKAHATALEKGFWENNNIPEKLMLIVSELGEACEALRKNNKQDLAHCADGGICCGEVNAGEISGNCKDILGCWRKDTFEDEIADVFIRLADLCAYLDIDIEWQIQKKMDYNKTREYKHGKQF